MIYYLESKILGNQGLDDEYATLATTESCQHIDVFKIHVSKAKNQMNTLDSLYSMYCQRMKSKIFLRIYFEGFAESL